MASTVDKIRLPLTKKLSKLVVIWVVWLLFVLFYVLFVCKCVLPPGDNPIAVNKYIISSTVAGDSLMQFFLEMVVLGLG